ncbi:MAG: DUF308 domain-containing protein [Clostridiales Family XIII bacterium]|jgi:uncharacterized membrane protein HdeD (DUF308 family)|nr:DUF308 domain-containing protein [Clostridiales Family XIII bacterium]
MRVLMIVMGVALTVTGVFCFMNLEKTWGSFAFVVGVMMLISGAGNVLSYLIERKNKYRAGWVLPEGLFTMALGGIALLYPFGADLMITAVFGVWLIMSGVFRLTAFLEMKGSGSARASVALSGLISVAVGIFGFAHPYLFGVALAAVLGVFFIMQGINALVMGLALPSKGR